MLASPKGGVIPGNQIKLDFEGCLTISIQPREHKRFFPWYSLTMARWTNPLRFGVGSIREGF
jgi:hypothetical protein